MIRRRWSGVASVAWMAGVCLAGMAWAQTTLPATAPASTQPAEGLPAGAVARPGDDRAKSARSFSVACFSPDGRQFFTLPSNRAPEVWDATTGKRVGQLAALEGSVGGWVDAAVTPDGKQLVAADTQGRIAAWDLAGGQVSRQLNVGYRLQRMALSPDGKLLACGGARVELWDLAEGRQVADLGACGGRAISLQFSADSGTLMVMGGDRGARLWDVPTRKQLRVITIEERTSVRATLSPDGKTLATAGEVVHLWDAQSGKSISELAWEGGQVSGNYPSFSPQGHLLAVARGAMGVELWDTAAGREWGWVPCSYSGSGSGMVCWSPDGKRLAVLMGFSFAIWDVEKMRAVVTPTGHWQRITALTASPDGEWLASADAAGRVVLWETRTWQMRAIPPTQRATSLSPFVSGRFGSISGLAYSADGRFLWIAGGAGTEWYDLRTLQLRGTLRRNSPAAPGLSAAPRAGLLASPAEAKSVALVDLNTGRVRRQVEAGTDAGVVALSPEGTSLAVAQRATIQVLSLADKDSPRQALAVPWPRTRWATFSPEGRWLLAGAAPLVRLWSHPQGQFMRDFKSAGPVAISDDGRLLALADQKDIEVREVPSGDLVVRLQGHAEMPTALAFLPDGRRLVCGADRELLVWDLGAALPLGDDPETRFPRLLMDHLWRDLNAPEAATAWRAVMVLRDRPAEALKLLNERLEADADPGPLRLERALAVLEGIGSEAARGIVRKLSGSSVPRVAKEVQRVLSQMERPTSQPATQPDAEPTEVVENPPATRTSRGVAPMPSGAARRIQEQVRQGNWRVVEELRTTLAEAAKGTKASGAMPGTASEELQWRAAVDGAGQYHLAASVPDLEAIYRNEASSRTLRSHVLTALAEIGDPSSVKLLQPAMDDSGFSESVRMKVAAAMVRRGEEAGRERLLEAYRKSLARSVAGRILFSSARSALADLYDEKLVGQLREMEAKEPNEPAKTDLRTLVEEMEVNALPLEQVLALADDADPAKSAQRMRALRVLGQRGTPEMIEGLMHLKLATDMPDDANLSLQRRLVLLRESAITMIRRRHWQYYRDVAATRPSAE